MFGSIGLAVAALIARKLFLRRKRELEERAIKAQLEQGRRQRRGQGRSATSGGSDVCVVCITNPKEVRDKDIIYCLYDNYL